ncbi:MAG: CidA/LrgA family protein [Clostridia bacterium]|jgi:holin-like protein|nr:CidA/LrgA family protein [Clostridia bacterium]
MKYIYQFTLILFITFLGEFIYNIIPLPIPASIYGLLIMLFCLQVKIIKLEMVKEAGAFLLEAMPLMFIPAAVGLLTVWQEVTDILLPLIIIIIFSTIIVMAATGRTTQFIIRQGGESDNERNNL